MQLYHHIVSFFTKQYIQVCQIMLNTVVLLTLAQYNNYNYKVAWILHNIQQLQYNNYKATLQHNVFHHCNIYECNIHKKTVLLVMAIERNKHTKSFVLSFVFTHSWQLEKSSLKPCPRICSRSRDITKSRNGAFTFSKTKLYLQGSPSQM